MTTRNNPPAASGGGGVPLDLTKAKSLETMDPAVTYLATLTKCGQGPSKTSGEPCANFEYTIEEPEKYSTRKVFDTVNLKNENTQGRFIQHMIALGETEENLKSGKFIFNPDEYEGRQVTLNINLDKAGAYEGNARMRKIRGPEVYASMTSL